MSEKLRILIADDHPLFREGVVHVLSQQPDFEVIAQADSGERAVRLACDLLPDIVLMDISMPGEGGIQATREITEQCPVVQVVMLTVSEENDDLFVALKAGARGYIVKGISAQQLVAAVRTIAAGEVFISPGLASSVLFEMTREESNPINSLTPREREILQLVSEGLTNRQIGERLFLAEKTVKHHMTNVLQKLQVRSRVQAALLAQQKGLSENRSNK